MTYELFLTSSTYANGFCRLISPGGLLSHPHLHFFKHLRNPVQVSAVLYENA